jgi:hypothetical protein
MTMFAPLDVHEEELPDRTLRVRPDRRGWSGGDFQNPREGAITIVLAR